MFSHTSATIFWLFMSLPPLGVSITYYRLSPAAIPFGQKLLVSAHGAFITGLCVSAVLIGMFGTPSRSCFNLFAVFCLAALSLSIFGVVRFQGRRSVHLAQIINAMWLSAAFLFGGMAVSGVWL